MQSPEPSHCQCFLSRFIDGLLNVIIKALLFVPDSNTKHECQKESGEQLNKCRQWTYGTTRKCLFEQAKHSVLCVHSGSVFILAVLGSGLPEGCVLDRILLVQKLDSLDIEGVAPLYQSVRSHFNEHPEDR